MIDGRKRLRVDDRCCSDDADVNTRLQNDASAAILSMSTEVSDIVESVGRVNGTVLKSAIQKTQQMQQALDASRRSTKKLWKLLARCQQNHAMTALSRLSGAEDTRRKEARVNTLQQQLESSVSCAAEEVSRNIDTTNAAVVAMFSSQLEGEQEINQKLGEYVREFLRRSLGILQGYSRRALEAELSVFKRDLSAARMKSSLAFYQSSSLRHHVEIMSLIKIVRLLAEKSKDVDLANSKLRQAKAHVRLLEKHLDLAGIVHAIVPPGFVPPRAPQDPPLTALQRTAPEYFALRLLEHRDVTLSELVDSWQGQEARIIATEKKYRELEVSVEGMRQDALKVYHSFLEEKRRREVVEHRLVDIVCERIHPNSNDSLVRQLTQLRSDYTKVLDDSSQLSTTLSVTREALAEQQRRCAALEETVQQMKVDSDADEVARTLASLRHYYEEEIERLRIGMLDAETHSSIAMAHAESQQESAACAHDTLATTQLAVMNMSAALERAEKKLLENQHQESGLSRKTISEEAQQAVLASEAHFNKAFASLQKSIQGMEAQRERDMMSFQEEVSQLLSVFTATDSVSATSDGNEAGNEALRLRELQGQQFQLEEKKNVHAMMREALTHALQFVSDELVTSEAAKESLLDVSISDAQHVNLLLEKVRELTTERDTLLQRLARCEQLIDQHSLTAVERVLMHDVPLEESFDAIDASEKIATLREKVESLETVRSSALAEVENLREELRQFGYRTEHGVVRLDLLERHNSCLMSSLEECLAREATLIEQVHRLQRNVQELAAGVAPEVTTCVQKEGGDNQGVVNDEVGARGMQERMIQQLEDFCGSILEVKEQLARSQIAAATPVSAEGGEVETQLLHKGLQYVADSLRDALQQAGIFRYAFPDEEERHCAYDKKRWTTTEARTTTTTTAEEEKEAAETASGERVTNLDGNNEVVALRERLADISRAHALELSLRDGELVRLRQELESHVQIEESLKKSQEDLHQQNAEVQKKVARLLQINKQLVEELKAARASTELQSN